MLKIMILSTSLALLLVSGATAQVAGRQRNQQQRIAQGVRSGSLTPRETARLERQEARLHREVRQDRRANGGTLSPADRADARHRQNQLSRQIYRQKHDGQGRY